MKYKYIFVILLLIVFVLTSCCEDCSATKVCENKRGHQYTATDEGHCSCSGCKLGYKLIECYKTCY